MKKRMEKPELEEIELDPTDVITTSGPMTDEGENTEEGYGGGIGFQDL